jgi:hypothetical protein
VKMRITSAGSIARLWHGVAQQVAKARLRCRRSSLTNEAPHIRVCVQPGDGMAKRSKAGRRYCSRVAKAEDADFHCGHAQRADLRPKLRM